MIVTLTAAFGVPMLGLMTVMIGVPGRTVKPLFRFRFCEPVVTLTVRAPTVAFAAMLPDAVLFVRSTEEVVELVRLCVAAGVPIVPELALIRSCHLAPIPKSAAALARSWALSCIDRPAKAVPPKP